MPLWGQTGWGLGCFSFTIHNLDCGPLLQAKSQFKRRSTANNVEIHIPVPNDADSPKFKTTVGSVKWVPENSEIVWSIKSFPVSTCRGTRSRIHPHPTCSPCPLQCCGGYRILRPQPLPLSLKIGHGARIPAWASWWWGGRVRRGWGLES